MITITDKNLRIPIKLWLEDIEDGALEQAKNLAKLSFAFKHIAIMPDAHQGYGMPIGGVLAAEETIIPNAVGVDIGCGMCAVKTSLKNIETSILKKILGDIRNLIPLGFKHHKNPQNWNGFDNAPDIEVIQRELKSAKHQLGTLGGGNHFIEIQKGSDNFIWLMIHSGSRNFGLQIAKEFHDKAKAICEKKNYSIPNKDLSFLPMNTKEADGYFTAMNYALNFAKENRFRMIEVVKNIITNYFSKIKFHETINIHHNYAALENHFGKDVIIHRKGATSANKNETGIIPGSQGTKSYIVKGKGNVESFKSCSHGAGRRMGRKQAQRELNLKKEQKLLDDKGILHSIRGKHDLDEAPSAYKNIKNVMKNQEDLVDIVVELSPLGVVKG